MSEAENQKEALTVLVMCSPLKQYSQPSVGAGEATQPSVAASLHGFQKL